MEIVFEDGVVELSGDEEVFEIGGELEMGDEGGLRGVGFGDGHLGLFEF